jgi:hypothetical protein
MTAATAIERMPGTAIGGRLSTASPQALTAQRSLGVRWEAVFRSANDAAIPAQPAIDLEPRTKANDPSATASSIFANRNAEPAAQRTSTQSKAPALSNEQDVQEESSEAVHPRRNVPPGTSSVAPALVKTTVSVHPAGPSIGTGRANASPGNSQQESGDSKKLSSTSPELSLITVAMAVPSSAIQSFASATPVPAKSSAFVDSELPPQSVPGAGNWASALSNVQAGKPFAQGSPIGAATAIESRAGWAGWNAATRSTTGTAPVPIAHVVSGLATMAPGVSMLGASHFAAPTDEGGPVLSMGAIHGDPVRFEDANAIWPDAQGATLSPAPHSTGTASFANRSNNSGEVATIPVPGAEAAGSASAAFNDSSVGDPALSGHDAAAKAKWRAGGEGTVLGPATQAASPSMVLGGSGAQGATFVSREPGSIVSAVQAPAHPGIAPAGAPHDAFAALDAGTSSAAPTWVHAGAAHAEAGFDDPALGWVGVRAELGSSGVHASLVPGSTDAALALSSHLAGLNAYLAEHHSEVSAVTLSAPENRSADPGAGNDGAGPAHQEHGQPAQQGSGSERGSSARAGATESAAFDSMPARAQAAGSIGAMETPGAFWMGRGAGVHISVIA